MALFAVPRLMAGGGDCPEADTRRTLGFGVSDRAVVRRSRGRVGGGGICPDVGRNVTCSRPAGNPLPCVGGECCKQSL